MNHPHYEIVEGSCAGTSDDIIERCYIHRVGYGPINRQGPGRTYLECVQIIRKLEREERESKERIKRLLAE